ncbi:hypothetical protein GGP41_007748 [Bipolaris sorokiniana]|uniref:Uncharacterized protein n=1 Tax=Cochliobolus sativus TaxID=45130 RepID=A0A8H5ZN67_COCSA|nr:hypothetical protein GGP41_007748 [Bipolaris sorokiniana]
MAEEEGRPFLPYALVYTDSPRPRPRRYLHPPASGMGKKEAQAHAPGCLSASPPCECERHAAAAAQESERTEANEFNPSYATSSRSPGDSDAWAAPWLLASVGDSAGCASC